MFYFRLLHIYKEIEKKILYPGKKKHKLYAAQAKLEMLFFYRMF